MRLKSWAGVALRATKVLPRREWDVEHGEWVATPEQMRDDGRLDGIPAITAAQFEARNEDRVAAMEAAVQQRRMDRLRARLLAGGGIPVGMTFRDAEAVLTPEERRQRLLLIDRQRCERLRRANGAKPKGPVKVVCSDRGERWPSAKAACAALGLSPSTIRQSIDKGYRVKGRRVWYERDGKPEERQTKRGQFRASVRRVEDGRVFETRVEVVLAHGFGRRDTKQQERLRRAIDRGTTYEGFHYVWEKGNGQQRHQDRPDGSRPDRAAGDLALRVA